MDAEKHAREYYMGLCVCDWPMRSKFHPSQCAICGGIIPRWRSMEMEWEEERGGAVVFVIFLLIMFGIIIAVDLLFPHALDGAINQIGR